ncbi:hypothetical protein GVAV_002279 [Gurleya vavrai]
MEMLKAANNIYDSKLLNEQALVKFVITKSPIPIRAMLFQVAGRDYDWQEVYKMAIESIWIAYPNQNIQDNASTVQENIFFTKKKYLHKNKKMMKFLNLPIKKDFFANCTEKEIMILIIALQ